MPARYGTEDDAMTLDELWRAALSRPVHGAACGCAVPTAVRLDPATIELDLLDYVEQKCGLDALPGWRDAVARRAAQPAGSFADWLASPERTGLDPALHDRVVDDIARSLISIATHAAGRLAPVGALGRGWLASSNPENHDRRRDR